MIKKFIKKFRNLILYGIIGTLSSSLDFVTYTMLVKLISLNYIFSNCLSVLVGICVSFTLNRKYNFKVKDNTIRRFMIFLSVGISGMLLSNLILYLLIDIYKLNEIISKLLSIVFVVIIQFILNKYITFKMKSDE